MTNKTTLRQDIKTAWVDGCKDLVGWLSLFGKPKTNPALEKEMKMMYATTKKPMSSFNEAFGVKPKRARGKKGKYLADDKSTPDVNEAWVGGKAPKKKSKKK